MSVTFLHERLESAFNKAVELNASIITDGVIIVPVKRALQDEQAADIKNIESGNSAANALLSKADKMLLACSPEKESGISVIDKVNLVTEIETYLLHLPCPSGRTTAAS